MNDLHDELGDSLENITRAMGKVWVSRSLVPSKYAKPAPLEKQRRPGKESWQCYIQNLKVNACFLILLFYLHQVLGGKDIVC